MTKKNSSHYSIDPRLAGGIIISSLIGAAAAWIMCTSKGKQLRSDLLELCHDASEKVQDFAHDAIEKTEDLSSKMTGHVFRRSSPNRSHLNLAIGALAGSILGISAAFLLSSESSRGFYENLLDKCQCWSEKTQEIGEDLEEKTYEVIENFEDRAQAWINIAKKFISQIDQATKEASLGRKLPKNSTTLNNALEWAVMGIRLFQSLKR